MQALKPQIIKTILFFSLFIYNSFFLFSQNRHNKIDSLLNLLKFDKEDTNKISHLNKLCWEYKTKAVFDSALYYSNFALQLSLKIKSRRGVADSYSKIGNVYDLQGLYSNALEFYFKALKIAEESGDKVVIGPWAGNIGGVYYRLGNYPKALEYYEKALKITLELGNKYDNAIWLNNIGLVFIAQKDYSKASDYFFKALKMFKDLDDKIGMANVYGNIGFVFEEQKNYSQAIVYYTLALTIYEDIDDKMGISINLGNIGALYTKIKNYTEAEKNLLKGLEISNNIGFMDASKEWTKELSKLYFETGKYQKAFEYQQQYGIIKDSIFNEASSKQITEMQTKYETEKKQKENEILAQENTIKSLEINQQKNQRAILISIFAFLLIAGFFIFNRIRLKQENKILLEKKLRASSVFQAQEKEKVHLSKELHDGLGPLLSLIKLNVSSLESNSGNEKMLNEIKELASEGMKEVRNISHTLMPTLLEKQGLEPALREFTTQIEQSKILKTEFTYNISTKLSKEAELNIYRIVQETLNNAIKHADANSASINLTENKLQYELTISDDGKGFDINKISEGNGLNNIYSRVDFLNGKAEIKSIPKKGTTFIISIPKKELI